jgi:hypothetical protein
MSSFRLFSTGGWISQFQGKDEVVTTNDICLGRTRTISSPIRCSIVLLLDQYLFLCEMLNSEKIER